MKYISTSIQAPYFTQGRASSATKYIWMACHGYGQLARYFMRRFDVLDLENKDFVLIPQGLSQFYLDNNYERVGASWITREDRQTALENMHNYLNAVFTSETQYLAFPEAVKLNLFGFSQGASAVIRWGLKNQLPLHRVFFWAGSFPPELTPEDAAYLNTDEVEVSIFIGDQDPFFTPKTLETQINRISRIFSQFRVVPFEGGHEVKREVFEQAVNNPMLGER